MSILPYNIIIYPNSDICSISSLVFTLLHPSVSSPAFRRLGRFFFVKHKWSQVPPEKKILAKIYQHKVQRVHPFCDVTIAYLRITNEVTMGYIYGLVWLGRGGGYEYAFYESRSLIGHYVPRVLLLQYSNESHAYRRAICRCWRVRTVYVKIFEAGLEVS